MKSAAQPQYGSLGSPGLTDAQRERDEQPAAKCPNCHGTGNTRFGVCAYCKGTGRA